MSYPEYPGFGPPPSDPSGESGQSPWASPGQYTNPTPEWRPPTQSGPVDESYPANPPQPYPSQPYPSQPYSGPLYPSQPYPGQPYGAQQQSYGTQPFLVDPNAQYGGWMPAPPRRGMPTAVKVLLIVLPIVVLVAAGAFLLGTHRHSGIPAASGEATATSGSQQTFAPGADHFTLPAKVDGLPASKDPSLSNLGKAMANGVGGFAGAPAVTGVYQSPTDSIDIFLLLGISKTVSDPAATMKGMFTGMATNREYTIGKQVAYPTGSQGGVMTCASATITESTVTEPIGICAIADNGGMIMSLYFKHSGATTAKVTKALRTTFEN